MALGLNGLHGPFICVALGRPAAVKPLHVTFPRGFGRQAGIEFLGQRQSLVLGREHDGHVPRPVFLWTPDVDVLHTVRIGLEQRAQTRIAAFAEGQDLEGAFGVVELADMVVG